MPWEVLCTVMRTRTPLTPTRPEWCPQGLCSVIYFHDLFLSSGAGRGPEWPPGSCSPHSASITPLPSLFFEPPLPQLLAVPVSPGTAPVPSATPVCSHHVPRHCPCLLRSLHVPSKALSPQRSVCSPHVPWPCSGPCFPSPCPPALL